LRSHCCEKIQNLYSKIQLLNSQQIDVDLLYVDVYVLQNSASDSNATIPGLRKNSNLRNDFERLGLNKRDRRSPGFEAATQYSRLMILGKPGSGKTTFLRHLAVANCKEEFLGDRIPVLIELRFITNISEFNLLNHIHEEFRLADIKQTKEILQQGKVVIFLDGLDEISSQFRRKIQDHIIEFSRNYYKTHLIITCRTQTSEYILPSFDYVEVADFNPQQVEQFAKNWFTALADTQQQAMVLTQRFIEKLRLPENKQTAELAVTPILLSLTCWVFNDLQDLPAKRSDLYERGIDLLLSKWDERRGISRDSVSDIYRKLNLTEKKQLLSYIAKTKFEQEQYILFEQSEIQGYIAEYLHISNDDAEVVLREIEAQHGLLIERSQSYGIWSFSHLTFQEYLVANSVIKSEAEIEKLIVYHFEDRRFREVFLLIISLTISPDKYIISMEKKLKTCYQHIQILEFIQWANKISCESDSYIKTSSKCAIAIYLAATFTSLLNLKLLNFSIDFEMCDSCLHIAFALDSKLKNAISHIPGFIDTSSIGLPLHRKLRRYYSRAVDADFDFGINTNLYRYSNLALTVAKEFSNLRIIENIDFKGIINVLEEYKARTPDDNSSFEDCAIFAQSICLEWLKALQLPEYVISLPSDFGDVLRKYLYMLELLIDCKEGTSQITNNCWESIRKTLLQIVECKLS
jgi:flagellar biosynthesis regulator FlaF